MKYRKIQTYNYTYKYLYIYSFFIPLPEFHVARKQIKVCPTCPQYMKGWAGLAQSDNKVQKGIAFQVFIWAVTGP